MTQITPRDQRPGNGAYVNCAKDYANENAARIDLMDALRSLEHSMQRLESASRASSVVAEDMGDHWRTLDGIRAAIEQRLHS